MRWQGVNNARCDIYLFSVNSVKNSVSSCPQFCFVQESHCCFSMPVEKSLKLISRREFISSSIFDSKDETNLCLRIPRGALSLHKILIGLPNTTAAAVAVTPRHITFSCWHSICFWWILLWAHAWPGPYRSSEINTNEGLDFEQTLEAQQYLRKQDTTTFQNTKQHFTLHRDNLENAAKFHQTLRHFRFVTVAFCEKSCLVKLCHVLGNYVFSFFFQGRLQCFVQKFTHYKNISKDKFYPYVVHMKCCRVCWNAVFCEILALLDSGFTGHWSGERLHCLR